SKKYVQTALVDEAELLKPILYEDNTLLYICGMKGMETGIYKELLRHELYGYLDIREKLPDDWESLEEKEFKRKIKPSDRTFEEVY
ncbi:MAG: hypothetical protein WD599_01005, partial [Balneolaceae bacterium]